MKNILLLSTERCGTTYLLDIIVNSLPRCYELNEFFNLHQGMICKHIDYIRVYLQQNKPECITPYKDLLNAIQNLNEEKHIYEDLVDDTHLRMKLEQLKEQKWNYSFVKVFDSHYKEPEKLLDMMDYLIVLYRNNLLSQFISHKKAQQSGVWYVKDDNKKNNLLRKSQNKKITWNKKDFLDFVETTTQAYDKFAGVYDSYKGNKIWICYEDIVSVHTKALCDGIHKDLDLPLSFRLYRENNSLMKPVKQSTSMSTEDNFTNPEMFLADLPDIKDKMFAY